MWMLSYHGLQFMCHKSALIVSPGVRATRTVVILRAARLRGASKDGPERACGYPSRLAALR
jgi:hypothetical protein